MEKILISLSGKAGSGKDEIGSYLYKHYGFRRFAFADLLKSVIGIDIFGFNVNQLESNLKDFVDSRYDKTPRELLQGAGMALRECYKDIWVLPLYRYFNRSDMFENVVVTDARFLNEIEAVKRLGGQAWLIERDEGRVIANPEHISENESLTYQHFDARISNNGSLQDLFRQIRSLLPRHKIEKPGQNSCPHCGANLTSIGSVIRKYPFYGRYGKDRYFEEEYNSKNFSDICAACEEEII